MNNRQSQLVFKWRHKFIFKRIISPDNLLLAWSEFSRGKRRKAEVQIYEFNLEENLLNLNRKLRDGTYQHDPYEPFLVYDPKLRHIHKARVEDRLVHQALFRILYHCFDSRFIYDSYSCRFAKGTHAAVERLAQFVRRASLNYRKPVFVLKCDVRKFFASVDQRVLLALIKKVITDSLTVQLIKKIISSFTESPGRGLPLGNVTSQLFANIYLNELDQFVKQRLRLKFYLRYCDDFVILHQNENYLRNLIKPLDDFLNKELKIALHPDKITVRKLNQGIDFLGYVTFGHYRIVRPKTRRRILRRVNKNNLYSYLGVCRHARASGLRKKMMEKLKLDI